MLAEGTSAAPPPAVAAPAPGERRGEAAGRAPQPELASLLPGQSFAGTYVLRKSELRQARNGKEYIDLELGDRSGALAGKLWDASADVYARLKVDYVDVTGRIELYNERRQIAVRTVRPAEGPVDPLLFLPRTDRDIRDMFLRLGKLHRTIECPYLRRLIKSFLGEEDFRRRFLIAPAAMTNHHAYLGGLLEHVLSLSEACARMAEHYPVLNRDLLLAGAFFHDIGKVQELSIGTKLEYSQSGRLIGHIVQGVLWLEDRARRIPSFPEDTLEHLKHLVLSHHGTREWGSPVEPLTAEAIALHHLDNLDAKLAAYERLVGASRDESSAFTDYSPMFRRSMFKGSPRRAASPAAPNDLDLEGPPLEGPPLEASVTGYDYGNAERDRLGARHGAAGSFGERPASLTAL